MYFSKYSPLHAQVEEDLSTNLYFSELCRKLQKPQGGISALRIFGGGKLVNMTWWEGRCPQTCNATRDTYFNEFGSNSTCI